MVRGEKAGGKRNKRKRVKSGENGSDDSDEDYVISEEEIDVSEDALENLDGSALDEDEIEDEYEEEEVEEEEYDAGKLSYRPRSSRGKKANNKSLPKNGAVSTRYDLDNFDEDEVDDKEVENEEERKPKKSGSWPRSSHGKKSEVGIEDEEDGEKEEEEEVNEEEEDPDKPHSRSRSSRGKKSDRKSLQQNRAVLSKDDDDEEYIVDDEDEEDDDDEDDDDEFTPEEEDDNDCLDDEEDSVEKERIGSEIVSRKNTLKRKASQRSGTKKKRSKISRKASKKIGTERIVVRRKSRSDNDDAGASDFLKDSIGWRRIGLKNTRRRKRRYVASSESDFVTSGSSDCDYTISEEERGQVGEANGFCGTLAPCTRKTSASKRSARSRNLSMRSSSSCNRTGEDDDVANQLKPTGAKGKEKVEESNVVKQVCGICLSEEDKRKVRGTLNCCSHYFCFTCIREWSKVESRCPLCKQRFHTITKPARCTAGSDLREDVIHVPERDQVYQPTDEEIRGYLDPYESVICTECLQGGDDNLMLLCDLCDSPAHTFCVGLGREVPEGSWYCYGCRPSALGSFSSHSQDNQRMSNNLSSWTTPTPGVTEGFDLNAPPSFQVLNLPSPRFLLGISQSLSPLSGAQAFTVSDRRMIYRHIQLRNGRSPGGGRTDASSASIFRIEPLPYPVDQGRLATLQPTGMEAMAPNVSLFGGLPQEISFPALQRREIPVSAAPSTSGRLFLNGYAGVNSNSVPDQCHQSCGRFSVQSDGREAPPSMTEQGYFCRPEEQLQAMIKMHLRSLSEGNALGYSDFKDIERSSIQNILAACGIGHRSSEVSAILPPSVCSHVDITGNGQVSLMKGSCSACFDVFVREVVQNNLNAKLQQQWLSLGL